MPHFFAADPNFEQPRDEFALNSEFCPEGSVVVTPFNGRATKVGNPTFAGNSAGIVFSSPSSTVYWQASPSKLLSNKDVFTLAIYFSTTYAVNSGGYAFLSERGTSGNDILKIITGETSNALTGIGVVIRNTVGTLLRINNSAYPVNDGKPHTAVLTKRAANSWQLYLDGAQIATSTVNLPGSGFTGTTPLTICQDLQDTKATNGLALGVAVPNFAWSLDRIQQFALDPYGSIFQAEQANFYWPSAGGGSDTSIAPPNGSATLVGYAPTLISPQSITPAAGGLSLTGLAASLSTAFKLTPDVGTLSIQGYAPSLAQNFSISPDAGVLSLLGSAPGLIQGFLLTPDAGSLALAGYAPSLGTAGSINPSDGTLTLVGYQPGVTQQSFIVPGAGTLTITGLTPSVAGAGTLIPPEANLTLVGYQPGVTQQTFIVPGVGAISVEAHAPLLVGNTYIVPGIGAATFAGYAPSVGLGTVVSPGTGQILLAGGTPSVIADSGSSLITPGSGSMGFVGYTPTVLTAVFVTGNGRVFWLPAQSVEWVLRAQATEWVLRAQATEWVLR